MRSIFLWALLFGAYTPTRSQCDGLQPPDDEAAIRKTIEAYVEAYGQARRRGARGLWSPGLCIRNRLTGEKAWVARRLRRVQKPVKGAARSKARRGATESTVSLAECGGSNRGRRNSEA